MAETIVIRFEGEDSGVCELTWGQRHIWDWIETSGAPLSMTVVRALDDGTKVDEIAEVLRFFMNRYQAMRTTLRIDADGRPRQVIARSGEVALEVVDTDTDPAATADSVAARHQATHFNYFHEWPVRMTLVRHRGAFTHVVTTLCHLVFDAAAAMVMFADLVDRDAETGQAKGPITGMTPMELAAWQCSPAGLRQSDAALRYWEAQLRALPVGRTAAAATDAIEHWQLVYDSPALALAAHSIVDQLAADTSSVLLAAYAVALARVTGRNPGTLELIVSNRFRPGYGDIASPVNQTGLCILDLAGLSFQGAVELVRRRTFTAYKHAYFDPARQQDMIARVTGERGADLGLGYFVNDRRTQTARPAGAPRPTGEEIRAARERGAIRWHRLESMNKRVMVYFDDATDAVSIMLHANGRYASRATMETLVREMEAVAVAAADDPGAPALST
jgi:hypothetical protein